MPWYSSNNMPAPFNQGQAPQGQAQQGMGIDPQMLTKAINAYLAMMGGGNQQQMRQMTQSLPPVFRQYINGLLNNYSDRGIGNSGGAFGYGDGPGYGGYGGGGMGPTSMGIAQQYGWE